MPRLFNLEVFNRVISGDNGSPPKYYSSAEHASVLGSADMMNVQIIIDSPPQTSVDVTVKYEINNDNSEDTWTPTSISKTVSLGGPTVAPASEFMTISSLADLGCYGRFMITSNQPNTTVRVIACGRSN